MSQGLRHDYFMRHVFKGVRHTHALPVSTVWTPHITHVYATGMVLPSHDDPISVQY